MNAYPNNDKRFEFIPFIINLLIPLVFGASSRHLAKDSISEWFTYVQKPWYTPSLEFSVFALIFIYLCLGIAAFGIWRRRKSIKNYKAVICIYFLQLFLHALWRVIYFNGRDPEISLPLIGASILISIITMIVFFRIKKLSGLLVLPFVLWLSVIFLVIYQIQQLN